MHREGAAIVDVGGESTRPGSAGVTLDEELRRVVPVLERLQGDVPVSIDTAKAEVARRALALGAELVNDVTALRGDAELAGVVADAGAYLCLMHMQGEPRTMQVDPAYDDVASDVAAFLEERLRFAVDAGIAEERICLDPGIGFGKTVEQNFELVARLDVLLALGRPVLVGFSRKSSLGRVLGDPGARTGSLSASIAAAVAAYDRGATILRVHDVKEHVEALTVARAVAMIVEIHGLELHGTHGVNDGRAPRRPAVPVRRDARGAGAGGGRDRRDRGLPRRSRLRPRGLRRARLPPARVARRCGRQTRSSRGSPSSPWTCACASPASRGRSGRRATASRPRRS